MGSRSSSSPSPSAICRSASAVRAGTAGAAAVGASRGGGGGSTSATPRGVIGDRSSPSSAPVPCCDSSRSCKPWLPPSRDIGPPTRLLRARWDASSTLRDGGPGGNCASLRVTTPPRRSLPRGIGEGEPRRAVRSYRREADARRGAPDPAPVRIVPATNGVEPPGVRSRSVLLSDQRAGRERLYRPSRLSPRSMRGATASGDRTRCPRGEPHARNGSLRRAGGDTLRCCCAAAGANGGPGRGPSPLCRSQRDFRRPCAAAAASASGADVCMADVAASCARCAGAAAP
jgi:hypothetical protein